MPVATVGQGFSLPTFGLNVAGKTVVAWVQGPQDTAPRALTMIPSADGTECHRTIVPTDFPMPGMYQVILRATSGGVTENSDTAWLKIRSSVPFVPGQAPPYPVQYQYPGATPVADQDGSGTPGPSGLKGDPGPPGPSGSAGGTTFNVSTPLSTWTFVHNLGRKPSVTITDSAGTEVWGNISYPDLNTVQVDFSAPFGGTAYVI